MNRITCKFEFECPKQWAELHATENKRIKFCSTCNHEVYLASSQEEFNEYAVSGKCVAIETIEWAALGVPEGSEIIEYSIYIPSQNIFGNKLKLVRDFLRSDLSLSEAKSAFNLKPIKIEGLDRGGAEEINKFLQGIAIVSEVQSKKI
jgi:hypothetical protein